MDFLFVVKFNGQTADLHELQNTIDGHSMQLLGIKPTYLIGEPTKGLIGIVSIAEDRLQQIQEEFFDTIRLKVHNINGLPNPELTDPATWARAPLSAILDGFRPDGTPDPKVDNNPYSVSASLQGGIGGKH